MRACSVVDAELDINNQIVAVTSTNALRVTLGTF